MSNRPQTRVQRYSRPPSLSTIGSNEEADFSSSRRNRQTFQSSYSVSPLEEQPIYTYPPLQAPTYPETRSEPQRFDDRSAPLNPSAYHYQQPLPGPVYDEHHFVTADEERGGFDNTLDKPHSALTKSGLYIVPSMKRSETSYSSSSSSSIEHGDGRKYMKTRYMWMLLQLDQIPWWHNLLAAAAAWIILAAYLVVPGTFTNFQKNNQNFDPKNVTNTPEGQLNAVANQVVASIDHLGLLIFSGILAGVGILVCLLLFFLHWQNYVWLSWKIFQPMMLNALAGLLTTVVNVMTTQKGVWSITAKINASVTGFVAAVAGSLFILYNFFLIEGVRRQHRKHFPLDAELVDPMKQHRIGKFLPKQRGY